MCGLVGHVVDANETPDIEAIAAANKRMQHRGPDGEGVITFSRACLAHRRLSIIDPLESGQPWLSTDGRYALVFNGEIYNYLELRKELEKAGFVFRSHGDTEVLLNAYIFYGAECLQKFNGMFSFAIWDDRDKKLFIARDRLGKKPLYYAVADHGIVFASEITALLAFPHLKRDIDPEAVHDFFSYQYVGDSRTIYSAIRKLPPGHFLTYHDGNICIAKYWKPPFPAHTDKHVSELADELVDILTDAVRLRLRSDVPLGAFLSGGLDSAVIVATMRQLGYDVKTFTVGFSDISYDERNPARQTAQLFGTDHHDQVMEMRFPEIVERWVASFGEPFADPSALPTWYLSQYARQFVTVALSGDGGDELFAGYRRYKAGKYLARFRKLPAWFQKGIIHPFANSLPDGDEYYGKSYAKKFKLFLRMADRLELAPNDLLPQTFSLIERRRLFEGGPISAHANDHVNEYGINDIDTVSQMMLTDIQTSLAEDILTKVDRMSMAFSLEIRCPLLDYRVVEFACRLPIDKKLRCGVQKYILQHAYRDKMPNYIFKRPKHGFAVPISKWFRTELKPLFESAVLDAQFPSYLNRGEVMRIWSDHQQSRGDNGFKLWSILVFFLWHGMSAKL